MPCATAACCFTSGCLLISPFLPFPLGGSAGAGFCPTDLFLAFFIATTLVLPIFPTFASVQCYFRTHSLALRACRLLLRRRFLHIRRRPRLRLRSSLLRIGHAIQEVVVINEPQGLDGERRGYIGVVDREQVIAIRSFAARRQVGGAAIDHWITAVQAADHEFIVNLVSRRARYLIERRRQ